MSHLYYKKLKVSRRSTILLMRNNLDHTHQGKGPLDSLSSNRPVCMLNTAGKLLETLLKPRLLDAIR